MLAESLQDYRAKYGDAAESPILEGDEDEQSQASTEPVGSPDVEMEDVGAGGNAASDPPPVQAAPPPQQEAADSRPGLRR